MCDKFDFMSIIFKYSMMVFTFVSQKANCCAYSFSCYRTASDANYWMIRTLFIAILSSCLEISAPVWEFPLSSDPILLWISSNFYPLILLFVRSHLAKIIIVKRHIQGLSNVTKVRVEPTSYDRRKNDAITLSVTLMPMI